MESKKFDMENNLCHNINVVEQCKKRDPFICHSSYTLHTILAKSVFKMLGKMSSKMLNTSPKNWSFLENIKIFFVI